MYQPARGFFIDCPTDFARIEFQPMPQDIPIDSDLVLNVQQGDNVAEDQIDRKYSDRLYFLALSELHSHQDAEDVRSETFIRVIQAVRQGKLRKPESLGSFVVGIALNVLPE